MENQKAMQPPTSRLVNLMALPLNRAYRRLDFLCHVEKRIHTGLGQRIGLICYQHACQRCGTLCVGLGKIAHEFCALAGIKIGEVIKHLVQIHGNRCIGLIGYA